MRKFLLASRTHRFFEPSIIFLICTLVYLANNQTIGAGDTYPNSLLAFNLLENHTLDLDIFRNTVQCPLGAKSCYYFVEGINGHLSSLYPIGTAILTFPVYIVCFVIVKILHIGVPLDITSVHFEYYRSICEKIAATIVTSLTVVTFYICSRIKFSPSVSKLSTFIFAFATNTWMTSSQALWQHGASNLVVILIVFCLIQTNRSNNNVRVMYMVLAGIGCGLLPGIRPTSIVFSIAAIVYSLFIYRSYFIFILIPSLISSLPCLIWNIYYFGNLSGGYSVVFNTSPYIFTLSHFTTAFLGTFISPSKGLLIFSPVVLYSLLGLNVVFRNRSGRDEKMIACMAIASTILLTSYCFYVVWWGGASCGPRFATDILPILCFIIGYYLDYLKNLSDSSSNYRFKISILTSLIIISFAIQFINVSSYIGSNWFPAPYNAEMHNNLDRLWQLKDSQIERAAKFTLHKYVPSSTPRITSNDLAQSAGSIVDIIAPNDMPLVAPLSVKHSSIIILKLQLINLGRTQMHGYQEVLVTGETRIRGLLYDQNNKVVGENRFYLMNSPKPQELSEAIGDIRFPQKSGDYRLVFSFIIEGMGEFPEIKTSSSVSSIKVSVL